MQDDDHAIRELAALLEADVKASGARTVAETKAALAASVRSLMSPAGVEVIAPSEDDKAKRLMTVRLTMPKLPL